MSALDRIGKPTASDFWNALIAIPAVVAWLGYAAALLIGPHLDPQPDPFAWALYAGWAWFALFFACVGALFALVILAGEG